MTETAGGDDPTIEESEARFHEAANGTFPVWTRRPDTGEVTEHQTITETITDFNTLLMSFRAWEGAIGDTQIADVMRSRFMWRSQMTLAARETLVTALGELPSVRFDGINRRVRRDGTIDPAGDARLYSAWVSDDADRVPILLVAKTDYGDIRMEIIEYVSGTSPNFRKAAQQ